MSEIKIIPTMILRRAFCWQHVQGIEKMRGIEAGGSWHHDWGLNTVNVDINPTGTESIQMKRCGGTRPVDIVASCEDMPTVKDNEFDFALASHVIEHVPNPIRAFLEFNRVVKEGGHIILAVPEKTRLFDERKNDRLMPTTQLSEIVKRYEKRVSGATAEGSDKHRSFWTMQEFLKISPWLNKQGLTKWKNVGLIDHIVTTNGVPGNEFLVAYKIEKK